MNPTHGKIRPLSNKHGLHVSANECISLLLCEICQMLGFSKAFRSVDRAN